MAVSAKVQATLEKRRRISTKTLNRVLPTRFPLQLNSAVQTKIAIPLLLHHQSRKRSIFSEHQTFLYERFRQWDLFCFLVKLTATFLLTLTFFRKKCEFLQNIKCSTSKKLIPTGGLDLIDSISLYRRE